MLKDEVVRLHPVDPNQFDIGNAISSDDLFETLGVWLVDSFCDCCVTFDLGFGVSFRAIFSRLLITVAHGEQFLAQSIVKCLRKSENRKATDCGEKGKRSLKISSIQFFPVEVNFILRSLCVRASSASAISPNLASALPPFATSADVRPSPDMSST